MTGLKRNSVLWLTASVLFLCVAFPVGAQTNTSFQYFYDDLGQLIKVVDSTGIVIEYVYDPVGNILQIKRSSVAQGSLTIFNFTPQSGGAGQTVTIQGQGFDPTPANNIVQFNGTAATVLSASATTLVTTVPVGASSGPISATVSGQTAKSSTNFTVLPLPVVVSLSRKSALFNTTFPGVLVTGTNFSGATFAFQPPAIIVTSAAIDSSGTSAVLGLKVGSQAGTFALVATNFAGSSNALPTSANRFTVVDPRSTADTDGDGIPDAIEAIFGTDPLDPNSVPVLASSAGQAESPAFTVLNKSVRPTPVTFQAESPAFTVLNGSSQPGTPRTFQADSPSFTVLNGSVSPPNARTFQAESPAFTVLNGSSQPGTPRTFQAESPGFTVMNSSVSGTKASLFAAESPLFSLLNGGPSTVNIFAESSLFSLLNSFVANSTTKGSFTAQNPLSSSQQTVAAGLPAQVQTARGRKLRLTAPAKKAKVRKTKMVSPGKETNRKPRIPLSSLSSSETETKSNDQQGVTHDSQHQ